MPWENVMRYKQSLKVQIVMHNYAGWWEPLLFCENPKQNLGQMRSSRWMDHSHRWAHMHRTNLFMVCLGSGIVEAQSIFGIWYNFSVDNPGRDILVYHFIWKAAESKKFAPRGSKVYSHSLSTFLKQSGYCLLTKNFFQLPCRRSYKRKSSSMFQDKMLPLIMEA